MAVDSLARAMAAGKTPVDAYQMAVAGGYTGTKEEFEEEMGNSAANASIAAASAAEAAASAVTAANVNANMAPGYDSSSADGYAVGEYVLYNNTLYACVSPVAPASAWDASKWEAVTVSGQLDDLGGKLTGLRSDKADAIHATAEGAIASFPDGADGEPMDSVVIGIDSVQDLHGYDNPWPAGGGVNKIDFSKCAAGITAFGLTSAVSGELFQFTGTCSSGGAHTWYFASVDSDQRALAESCSFAGFIISGGSGLGITSVTYDASAYKLSININGLVTNTNYDIKIGIVAYSGTAPTSWTPYSNICPITGHTAARVTRTGKNLLAPLNAGNAIKYNGSSLIVANVTDGVTITGQNGGSGHAVGFVIEKADNFTEKTLTLSVLMASNGTPQCNIVVCDEQFGNRSVLGYRQSSGSITVTIPQTAKGKYIGVALFSTAGQDGESIASTYTNLQLELGSTATSYAPYAGQIYDIAFPSEAGTVYGGTLNVTTGVLTVTHGYVDLGSLEWEMSNKNPSISQGIRIKAILDDAFGAISSAVANAVCSDYKILTGSQTYGGITGLAVGNAAAEGGHARVQIFNNQYNDLTPFENSLDGVQLVYELATPVTYQLTPTQIDTLLGTNNIWADTGDSSVGYIADTKLYIEQLTKPGDEDMVANANIASGKFFLVGNSLFYSTTAIAAGATIIPGTNCTAVSLADALNQLNT